MKIIINENQLTNFIYHQFDKLFNVEDINFQQYTDDYGKEFDSYNFYYGDFSDDDSVFIYINDLEDSEETAEIIPYVSVVGKYGITLNNLFGDMWKQPFKIWFEDKFNLPVKTVK